DGFFLRFGQSDVEIRVFNSKWSLPTGVSGSFVVTIGPFSKEFAITDNTDTMVIAQTDADTLTELFSQMDKSSKLAVVVGKAKAAVDVSLTGSTVATNAFRTCAGMRSHADGAGTNPFE
ncbi:MAG: hypothetical protein JO326_10465, partial [Acetobacteraceae bacterium]|nr:hypothetical protein [Acetobacteraceae bacterium]